MIKMPIELDWERNFYFNRISHLIRDRDFNIFDEDCKIQKYFEFLNQYRAHLQPEFTVEDTKRD